MTLPDIHHLTIIINLVLSITIVVISIWGYRRIGKPTPLYFGCAYALFAISHIVLLADAEVSQIYLLIAMRTIGYILVAVGLFALMQDIIERQRIEHALRESEEHVNATFDQSAVGIVEFLPNTRISRHNSRFAAMLGRAEENLDSVPVWDLIPPDEYTLHSDAVNQVVRCERHDYSADMRFLKRDGSPLWCQVSLSAVASSTGQPKYFVLVVDDISERKRAEEALASLNASLEDRVAERTRELQTVNAALVDEVRQRTLAEEHVSASLHEKEVLIKEIHHRVKNNLQIIISLLFLQARQTSDPGSVGALMDSQTRVQSMALVHEKLYQSTDLSAIDFEGYLNNLVANLTVLYGVDKSRIKVQIAVKNLPLTINTAIPLGLMMNELVSNTLKYAFPDNRPGTLSITGAVDGNRIRIRVHDDGVGIPESFDWKNAKSLGLHLIQMLTRQLKGTVELSRGHGTEFSIDIPLREGA